MVKQVRIPARYTKYLDKLEKNDAVAIWKFGEANALKRILKGFEVDTIKCCPIGNSVFSLHKTGGCVKKTFIGLKYNYYDIE